MKFSRLAALVVFIFPINYCLLALNIDSLVVEAERIEDKQDAFLIYRNIALKLIERNADSALLFANKAAVKAKASGRPKAKYYADKLFGKVYREQGEKDVALEYFFTAIDSAKSDSNYKAVSYIYSDIAELHRRTGAYHKAIETYDLGLAIDPDNAELKANKRETQLRVSMENQQGEIDPERRQQAMQDPEIQAILADPNMRSYLQQMQTDPKAAQKIMMNPEIRGKINKLVQAGVLQVR